MRSVWLVAGALALAGSSAWAAEDPGVLRFSKTPDDKALRAALPPGSPSTDVRLDCLAGIGRYESCVVEGLDPGAAITGAAIKVALDQRFNPTDRTGAPAVGRHFQEEIELIAPGDKNPDWLSKPTGERLAALFPVKAVRDGKPGSATISCRVTVEGYLDRCKVVAETPAGYDFGEAALQLSQQFRMTPKIRGGRPVEGTARIPINWAEVPRVSGPTPKERVLTDPNWRSAPSSAAVKAAYPAKAGGVPSGQAALRCDLTGRGRRPGAISPRRFRLVSGSERRQRPSPRIS